jgi:hypothetical protein
MADAIDELIIQLETFAGLRALPHTARDIIQSAINDRLRESLEKVAREARRYSESYKAKAKAKAEADAQPVLLVEPPKRQARRKKNEWNNAQKADYWGGLEQVIRREMPRDPAQHRASGRLER